MSGFANTTCFASGYKITPTTSGDLTRMQEASTDIAKINHTGDPEGVVAANPGSTSHDPVSGNIYFKQTGTGNTGWIRASTTATDLHTAKFIVGDLSNGANYSTIAAAITAASSGDTVFIQNGTYIENLTGKAGVNLTTFSGDCDPSKFSTTANVIIKGKFTATFAGTCSISNIRLQTNADYVVEVTGSSNTIVILNSCFLDATDFSLIHVNSSGSRNVYLNQCQGSLNTTGVAYFVLDQGGSISHGCYYYNQAGSAQANTVGDGSTLEFHASELIGAITTSGAGSLSFSYSGITSNNAACITMTGTSALTSIECLYDSGTASAIVIGAGCTASIRSGTVVSSNVNAIDGAGSIESSGINFAGTSSKINVTTQTYHAFTERFGGTAQTSYAAGDILYASATNVLSKLPKNLDGQVLTLASGLPSWATPTTGTVTSVTGTLNRITSTGGATPVIDISASYVGQSSLTTLGTITTGTWNATVIGLAYGGTNANLTASNGGIFYSTATAGAILAGTATATQMLQSGASTTPAWSTTTWPATSTINQILYSSAANVVSGLTVANTSLLRTSATGVPSWGSNLSGDFTFTTGTAGTTRTLTVNNTNNSNTASNAQFTIAQGGTSGGYAGMTWEKGTTRSYAMGMTSGSSETLVINTTNAAGVTPASGTGVWSMTNTGIHGLPLQPSCSAYLNATQTNVTGDATEATLICETELYDTGNNYNTTTGVYTVPAGGDGNYAIGMQIAFGDLAVANTTGFLHIAAGGANFYKYFNPGLATATQFCADMNILRNLTAGQTITCSASVSGGTKIVDFNGSGNVATFVHFHKLS